MLPTLPRPWCRDGRATRLEGGAGVCKRIEVARCAGHHASPGARTKSHGSRSELQARAHNLAAWHCEARYRVLIHLVCYEENLSQAQTGSVDRQSGQAERSTDKANQLTSPGS